MITFKAIVIPNNRRKDGTYPVKIRVTFKGVSRRLPTTMVCTSSELTRSLKIKDATILGKADELIGRMRYAVKDLSSFDLEYRDVDWVVSKIKNVMTGENFRLDVFAWGEEYIQTKNAKTGQGYHVALNALERFLGCRHLDINAISRSMLIEFMEYIDREPKMYMIKTGEWKPSKMPRLNNGASARHLSKLQCIYNAAKDRYNDEDSDRILIPRSPFDKVPKRYPVNQGQKNLGQELMQTIISSEEDDPIIRCALDVFIVSFGCMGANMADLYAAKNIKGNVWVYNRQKTKTRRADKAEMRIDVPDCIRPFLDRLQGGSAEWWLPALHATFKTSEYASQRINMALKRWCLKNDIPVFTFYAARHTWASLARKVGVEKATIDECLCHIGDYKITDIYAERSWNLLTEANRKVLDIFTW